MMKGPGTFNVTTTYCGSCHHPMHWHECGEGADQTAPCACRNDVSVWDFATPPTTANDYSKEAADSVLGSAGTLRRQVARWIAMGDPLTEHDLEVLTDLSGNTVRPRLWELQRHGIIELDPEPGVTPSGRKCGRYRITALGRKLLAL